jgi:dolichol-phosphate hexosyltransferase
VIREEAAFPAADHDQRPLPQVRAAFLSSDERPGRDRLRNMFARHELRGSGIPPADRTGESKPRRGARPRWQPRVDTAGPWTAAGSSGPGTRRLIPDGPAHRGLPGVSTPPARPCRFPPENSPCGPGTPSAVAANRLSRETRVVRHLPPQPFKLSILMPVYNEERTIESVVGEILAVDYPCDIELIVVDDGSTDRTPVLLENVNDTRVMIHRHRANRGKGAAVLSAITLASGTYVLPFDADLEYAAEDIPRLLRPVLSGRCEVVYGVRLFGCNTVYQSYRYAVANQALTRTANVLFNANLTDLHTCLKLLPLAMLKDMHLSETGFGLDTQITASLLRLGIRPFEVPVSYYGRSREQGKKITWHDAIACLWILARERVAVSTRERATARARCETREDRRWAGDD